MFQTRPMDGVVPIRGGLFLYIAVQAKNFSRTLSSLPNRSRVVVRYIYMQGVSKIGFEDSFHTRNEKKHCRNTVKATRLDIIV